MFNPTLAQRVNERYRRLLIARAANWTLPLSEAELTLFYNFAKQPNLEAITNPNTGILAGPPLDFTRTTTSKFTDYNNVLKEVQTGEAKFTGCRRVENLTKQSNNFDTSWLLDDATIVEAGSGVIDPFNGTDAWILTDNAVASRHSINLSAQPHVDHTYSIYVKYSGGIQWVLLSSNTNSAPESRGTYFDILNGVKGVGAQDTGNIEAAPNGWFRIWIDDDVPSPSSLFSINMATADGTESYTGTTQGCYIYGAQNEFTAGQPDPAPSEYIPTVLTPVARNFATKRRTNILGNSDWLGTLPLTGWTRPATDDGATAGVSSEGGNAVSYRFVSSAGREFFRHILALKAHTTYTFSVFVESIDVGTNGNCINISGLTGVSGDVFIAPSGLTAGERFSLTFTTANDVSGLLDIGAGANDSQTHDLTFSAPMLEEGSVATAYVPVAEADALASSSFDTAITATGLLIEEVRTNICLQSENFGTTWVVSQVRVNADTLNVAIAPDGTTTADRMIDDGGGSTGSPQYNQTITVVAGNTYTFSVFAKAEQLDWLNIVITDNGSQVIQAFYDLTNGAVGATLGADNVSQSIRSVGNGWYRCIITFVQAAADTSSRFRLYIAEADNDNTVDRDDSSSILLWGADLQVGAFPTSYIPTTTASKTRNADDVTTTDVSWLNAEGTHTLFVKYLKPVAFINQGLLQIDDGSNLEHIRLVGLATPALRFQIDNLTGSPVQTGDLPDTVNAVHRGAYALASGDQRAIIDGGTIATGTNTASYPVTGNLTTLRLGNLSGTFHWNGHISEVRYYNGLGVDSELEDLTNGNLIPALT